MDLTDVGAFEAADDVSDFLSKADLQMHPHDRRLKQQVDNRVSSRLKPRVLRFRDEAKQAKLAAQEKVKGELAQKCEKEGISRAAVMRSMMPRAKCKPVKSKDVKSKTVKSKLSKKWLASAAKKTSIGPLQDQIVRVCDEQSTKRAFGVEGKVLQHSVKNGTVLMRVNDSAMQLSTMAQYVEPCSKFTPLPKEKSLRKLTNDTRMMWLEDLGFGSMLNPEFPQSVDELAGFKPVKLRAEHIRLQFKYIMWTFDIDSERVKMVDPTLVCAWMAVQNWHPDEKLSVCQKEACVKQARVLERTLCCFNVNQSHVAQLNCHLALFTAFFFILFRGCLHPLRAL